MPLWKGRVERRGAGSSGWSAEADCGDTRDAFAVIVWEPPAGLTSPPYDQEMLMTIQTRTDAVTHGKRSTYVAGCRCAPCTEANRVAQAAWARRRLYGVEPSMTDAQPVREHVQQLMAQGMGWRMIAKAAGVGTTTMGSLLYGRNRLLADGRREPPSRRMHSETAARIMAVELTLADGAVVDATGTVRRLQALVAAGTSQSDLASRLGMLEANFGRLVNADPLQTQVTVKTRAAVAALYEQLWNPACPDSRAVAHARRKGWPPPMAWDDETIDDPNAVPEGVGPAGARRAFDEVVWRRELGEPLEVIARDLGIRLDSLERNLARHHARSAVAHRTDPVQEARCAS